MVSDKTQVNLHNIERGNELDITNFVDIGANSYEVYTQPEITSADWNTNRSENVFLYTCTDGTINVCDLRMKSSFWKPSLILNKLNRAGWPLLAVS